MICPKVTVLTPLLAALCMAVPLAAHAVNLGGPDPSATTSPAAPKAVHPDKPPEDSDQTTFHWKKARNYQKDMRLELSRQHFLLALSACRSEETRDRLQRELQIVELQLRSMR